MSVTNAPQSLLAELETAIKDGSHDKRLETLRRVGELFFAQSDRLSEEQVDLFDAVLARMITHIESRALKELSGRMAPLANAPINVVRSFAQHDDIEVAAPVLRQSPRLSEAELIEIAETKGQGHLVAISSRSDLGAPLTDVLLRRGDTPVFHELAGNANARFSDGGFRKLAERSQADVVLAERMVTRADLPADVLQHVIEQATEEVRYRLLSGAPPGSVGRIDSVLAGITKQLQPRDYTAAQKLIASLKEAGTLNRATLTEFVKAGRNEELVAALALRSGAPIELVGRVFDTGRYDAVLLMCKAAGMDWSTVRLLLQKRPTQQIGSEHDLGRAAEEFDNLTERTAQRVLRFWQVRQTVKEQTADTPH